MAFACSHGPKHSSTQCGSIFLDLPCQWVGMQSLSGSVANLLSLEVIARFHSAVTSGSGCRRKQEQTCLRHDGPGVDDKKRPVPLLHRGFLAPFGARPSVLRSKCTLSDSEVWTRSKPACKS
eukprot:5928155-Amphidinium_carterae.1